MIKKLPPHKKKFYFLLNEHKHYLLKTAGEWNCKSPVMQLDLTVSTSPYSYAKGNYF